MEPPRSQRHVERVDWLCRWLPIPERKAPQAPGAQQHRNEWDFSLNFEGRRLCRTGRYQFFADNQTDENSNGENCKEDRSPIAKIVCSLLVMAFENLLL